MKNVRKENFNHAIRDMNALFGGTFHEKRGYLFRGCLLFMFISNWLFFQNSDRYTGFPKFFKYATKTIFNLLL